MTGVRLAREGACGCWREEGAVGVERSKGILGMGEEVDWSLLLVVVLLLLKGEEREVCKFLILLAASCREARGCRRRTVEGAEETEEAAGFEGVDMVVDVDVDIGVGVGGVGGVMRARASLPRQCGCAGEELRVEIVGVGLFCALAGGVNCLVCGVL